MSTPSPQKPQYRVEYGPNGPRVVSAGAATPSQAQHSFWPYVELMRLNRPVGILLLLWPTLAALWLAAGGVPSLPLLVIFSLGVVLTRSAGCVINDYADQWLDASVERTHTRVLARGALTGKQALILFAALMLSAFALVLLCNRTTVYLSVLALLIAVLYPYCKRHTYYAQVVLGLAFSMGIPMAYTALGKPLDAVAGLLLIGNLLWTIAYDTLYAMVDREDDVRAGAKSTAILFGELDIVIIAILQSLCIISWSLLAYRANLGWPAYLGIGLGAACFCFQIKLARTRIRSAYFKGFLLNQWVGLALFAGLSLAIQLKPAPIISSPTIGVQNP
jgi:4-hydroxybenzoate polyprenyltransferase